MIIRTIINATIIKNPAPKIKYGKTFLFTQTNLKILQLWPDQFCRQYNP